MNAPASDSPDRHGTSLYGMPPMPPPPPEEPPTALPEPPPPAPRTVITVRYNRRLAWWLAALGWPLIVPGAWASYILPPTLAPEAFILHFAPLYAAVLGTAMLLAKPCLTYDTRTGHLWGGSRVQWALGKWREGDRIEFSAAYGALELVHANGKRRRILRGSILLNREDWTGFAEVFLGHQRAREADERVGIVR